MDRITWEGDDGIAVIRMDDGKVNAIERGWCEGLNRILDDVEQAKAVAAAVLLGRPGCFCAGLDLKRLPTLAPEDLRATTDAFVATMERVFLYPKPVIAASAGHALAGGLMLFLAADARLALDDGPSRYGLPEVTQGIPLIGPTAAICAAGVPAAWQAEVLLHGRRLSAREAFERGLIHELAAEPEALERRARERARDLRGLDLGAYRVSKRALREPALAAARAAAVAVARDLPRGNPFRRG